MAIISQHKWNGLKTKNQSSLMMMTIKIKPLKK